MYELASIFFFVDFLLLLCFFFSVQAERIMEALELYKGEARKMEEHKYACENAGKEVEISNHLRGTGCGS